MTGGPTKEQCPKCGSEERNIEVNRTKEIFRLEKYLATYYWFGCNTCGHTWTGVWPDGKR
jgi:predicted nucleic-acid-binding Zn-ribbon protein